MYDSGKSGSSISRVVSDLHVITLDGPINYHLEQILGAARFSLSNSSSLFQNGDFSFTNVILPSAEKLCLPSNVTIVIETNDLSHTSPALLMYCPVISINVEVNGRFSSQ
jgi:hypothetical protein